MSNVYKKLMQARLMLQNTKLEKSGHNKFAGYKYFELGDFLPTVQNIFVEVRLCGVVSYTQELATLTIFDVDEGGSIVITSPMGSAALKGCHEVQNIGAVETYQRRYLWVTAMEIVEHDVLDATTGDSKFNQVKLPASPYEELDEEAQQFIKDLAIEIIADVVDSKPEDAYKKSSNLLNSEKQFLWTLLDSKTRSALKKQKDISNG
jgi:hypothetical protein